MRKTVCEKKISPADYRLVQAGIKRFVFQKEEGDLKIGDILRLREWDGERYTGNAVNKTIIYVEKDRPEEGLTDVHTIYGF